MIEIFTDILHNWQNFYFMIGGASAGLMGLMFVALSLGMNLANEDNMAEFSATAGRPTTPQNPLPHRPALIVISS